MPPVTQSLLIANVVVFLLQMSGGLPLIQWFALWPGEGFFPWQLVTYSFLHGSISHIFFNMFGLYMFGSEIERLFGSRFYLLYYFAPETLRPALGWVHSAVGIAMGVFLLAHRRQKSRQLRN